MYSTSRASLSLIFNVVVYACFGVRDNHQALKDERISKTGREINKDIVAKKTFTDSCCAGRLSDSSNCFSLLQKLISTDLCDRRRVYFVYLVFIESITMIS